jgi:predicted nucleic acid-binding protein
MIPLNNSKGKVLTEKKIYHDRQNRRKKENNIYKIMTTLTLMKSIQDITFTCQHLEKSTVQSWKNLLNNLYYINNTIIVMHIISNKLLQTSTYRKKTVSKWNTFNSFVFIIEIFECRSNGDSKFGISIIITIIDRFNDKCWTCGLCGMSYYLYSCMFCRNGFDWYSTMLGCLSNDVYTIINRSNTIIDCFSKTHFDLAFILFLIIKNKSKQSKQCYNPS